MASRSFHLRPQLLAAALCAGLLACGGSSEHLTPPSFSNFSYGPSTATLNQGLGKVDVSWSADSTDSGADITQEVIVIKSDAGAVLATFNIPISNPAGVTSGHFTGTITLPTTTATTFRFTIQIIDGHGTGSNVLEGSLTIS